MHAARSIANGGTNQIQHPQLNTGLKASKQLQLFT